MENLVLPPLFCDGMVVQRGQAFPVWGQSLPGREVMITFCRKTCRCRADQNGKWRAVLEPIEAGGPFTMDIVSGDETISIKDIYSGDVWLCSGQSNMELTMQRLRDDFPEEWTAEFFPLVRQFKVPQEWDFSGPREELGGGSWIAASRETLDQFSGTAWFFARRLYQKYRVPIGLIVTAWGGTPVESWMSCQALEPFPQKIASGGRYADPAVCESIAATNGAEIRKWETLLAREDRGLIEEWQKPETDISRWNEVKLPGDFEDTGTRPELNAFCGVIWLCREFDADADFAAQDTNVWLGTIVDADTVFINGVEVGNTAYRYPPRKYAVPAGLLQRGKNRIVIRVICANGQGGITTGKPFRVFSERTCIELEGIWKYHTGIKAPPCPESFFFQRQPMGPYNAMIAPVLKYPLRGVIWYQGESNDANPHEYAALFAAMIQDWRTKSGNDNLPFLFVQLPVYGVPGENDEASSWALIREAQASCLALPFTGMAAALELGEWNDLHPINKKDVGYRLFLAAEQTVFGNKNTAPGPLVRGIVRQGTKITISFANCGSGICSRGEAYVTAVLGNTRKRLPAKIEGPCSLSVDISSVEKGEKLLYAWADNPQDRQLFNSEGLPLIPFRAAVP